jgi:peptidoglycan/xylan/chitin deacetylase (PgdA/CDA1 family)
MSGKNVLTALIVAICFFLSPNAQARDLQVAMCSLTFDDGEKSLYDTVYKNIFKNMGIPGTAYIVTDWIGDGTHVTWDQLTEMVAAGWKLGSHMDNHPHVAVMTNEQIIASLQRAQNSFVSHNFKNVCDFAVPYGELYDSDVVDPVNYARILGAIKSVGFITSSRRAWIENDDLNTPANFDPWAVNVVPIKQATTWATLKNAVDEAVSAKAWLAFAIHDVVDVPAANDNDQVSTAMINQLAAYLKSLSDQNKIKMVTVTEAVQKISAAKNGSKAMAAINLLLLDQ